MTTLSTASPEPLPRRAIAMLASLCAGCLLVVALATPSPDRPGPTWIERHLSADEQQRVQRLAEEIAAVQGPAGAAPEELRTRVRALSIREAAALGTLLLDGGHPDPAAWLMLAHERETEALDRLRELQNRLGYPEPDITYLETTVQGPQRLRIAVGEDVLTEVTGAALLAFYDGGIPAATDFGDEDVATLLHLPGLEWIHADWSKLTDAGVIRLASLPRLNDLRIGGADVGDASLDAVGRRKSLRVLDVSGAKRVTDAGVAALAGCRTLESLNLSQTGITSQSLPTVSSFRQLRELNLSNTGVREGLWRLGVLKRLERLELGGLGNRETPLTGDDFAFLRKLRNLQHLSLRGTWTRELEIVDFPDLEHLYLGSPILRSLTLEKLPQVQSLRVLPEPGAEPFRLDTLTLRDMDSLVQVRLPHLEREAADGMAEGLPTLPRLAWLEFDGTVTDSLAAELGECGELFALELGDAAVKDSQLAAIAQAPKLQRLTLNGSELTGEGLSALANAKTLSRLTIFDLDVGTADFRFPGDAGVDVRLNGGRIDTLRIDAESSVRSLYLIGTVVREVDVRDSHTLTGLNMLDVTIDRLTVAFCLQLESFFCGYESKIGTLQLRHLPRLYSITIQERANPGEMDWAELPAVRRVSFWAGDVGVRHIRLLQKLPQVTKVDVSGTYLGDEAAAILARVSTLQSVSASGSFQTTGLEKLRTLPNLKTLLLYHHDGVDWTPQQARQMFDHVREMVVF